MKNFKDYKNNDRKENLKLESIVVHGANEIGRAHV